MRSQKEAVWILYQVMGTIQSFKGGWGDDRICICYNALSGFVDMGLQREKGGSCSWREMGLWIRASKGRSGRRRELFHEQGSGLN